MTTGLKTKSSLVKKETEESQLQLLSNLEQVKQKLKHKYGKPIGAGRSRIVFDAGNWVVKVPREFWNFGCNYQEASFGARELKNENYATCRLFHIRDIPVLWMEKVEKAEYSNDMPDWVAYIDCQQVGYTRKGKLVAYDYGE